VGFVVDKVAMGLAFSRSSVSPTNSYSTDCSTLIYHPYVVQQAQQVRTKCTQLWVVTQFSLVEIYQTFRGHIASIVKVDGFKI
jgi:hypothetical protein